MRELLADYDRKHDPHYVPEEELVAKAIEILSQDPDGFFLAIDVDEIDVGGHASHAGLVIKSADMLNRIVGTIEAYRATDPNLLVVVTADHETGGMTIEGPKSNSTWVLGYPIPKRWRNGPFGIEGTEHAVHDRLVDPGPHRRPGAADRGRARLRTARRPNDNTDVFDVARGVLTGSP